VYALIERTENASSSIHFWRHVCIDNCWNVVKMRERILFIIILTRVIINEWQMHWKLIFVLLRWKKLSVHLCQFNFYINIEGGVIISVVFKCIVSWLVWNWIWIMKLVYEWINLLVSSICLWCGVMMIDWDDVATCELGNWCWVFRLTNLREAFQIVT